MGSLILRLPTLTSGYFDSLNAYRTGDIEPVISTFVDAAFGSLAKVSRLVEDPARIRQPRADSISARADSTIWPLLDLCVGRPAVSASLVAADLARRNRIWLVPDVFEAVDQFMDRARRR
ncbi:MAG: hypothetical protein ACI8Y4_005425 [Candidatus Poriferisodalaceae bacterium]